MTGLLLPRETDSDKTKLPPIIESLMNCLKVSFLEEARGKMRKKWLHEIVEVDAQPRSLTDPIPAIEKAFEIIMQDSQLYGAEGAQLSATVAEASGTGREVCTLTFLAATADDRAAVGKSLSWTDPDAVSFSAVTEGLPIHVVSIFKHQHVKMFRDVNITQESDGSVIIYPLCDRTNLTVQNGVIGTLAVDTASGQNNIGFQRHQINFYQVC